MSKSKGEYESNGFVAIVELEPWQFCVGMDEGKLRELLALENQDEKSLAE